MFLKGFNLLTPDKVKIRGLLTGDIRMPDQIETGCTENNYFCLVRLIYSFVTL